MSDQAKNHIGDNATVCGVIAGAHYRDRSSSINQVEQWSQWRWRKPIGSIP
jgi:hypothetical protein